MLLCRLLSLFFFFAMLSSATEDGEVPAATTNAADTIVVKGKESDVDAAIAALQALVPETEEYPFPSEFHGNLIGQKGEGIRKIMTENDINIKIPNQADNVNSITLKGLRANIEATKAVLAKRLVELDADKAVRLDNTPSPTARNQHLDLVFVFAPA